MKPSESYELAAEAVRKDIEQSKRTHVVNKKELEDIMFLKEHITFLKTKVSHLKGHKKLNGIVNYVNTHYGYSIDLTPAVIKVFRQNYIFKPWTFKLYEYIVVFIILSFVVNVLSWISPNEVVLTISVMIILSIYVFYDSNKK